MPFAALVLAWVPTGSVGAQEPDVTRDILASQRRLEEIRTERMQLQGEMDGLRTRARDASAELRNVERQLSASRSVLAEVDFQVEAVAMQNQRTSTDLAATRDRLRSSQLTLNERLRLIYKDGPMHTVRVLLGADSFSNLLNRYRYLRLIAAYDRALVDRVSQLESSLVLQDRELQQSLVELERLRRLKEDELTELRNVEATHQRMLNEYRSEEALRQGRIEKLDADHAHLEGLLEDLEATRVGDAPREVTLPSATTGFEALDEGSLDWPVEGSIVYRFGREERPNGIVLRWNGLGIGAPTGTPVRAVMPGRVVLAGPFEGYGPTVVVSHGDGFYTLYLYLQDVGVVEGRDLEQGQIVGTVGGRQTPEGAHMEFQIRGPVDGTAPQALDPLRWLKPPEGAP
jgi:septal ring factor EnvC (AmiA/AmiB activator)